MNKAKIYQNSEGYDCSLYYLVRREPAWAAHRVQEGEKALEREAKLRDAANVALGHLTGGMDGDWRDCDPVELLREALSS
jgi:hypothetical protein